MSEEDSAQSGTISLEDQLARVDGLLGLPFPEAEWRDENRYSGPGHHLLVVRASRDFWDDPEVEVVWAARREIEAGFHSLVTALTVRWGEPETVDLWSYQEAAGRSRPRLQPIDELCMLTGSMQVWRVPGEARWLALAIGQGDKELPFELLAAVGEAAALPRVPGQS
jgi:hypothetical protein